MRERIGQPKKATTASFSIPTLKQPTRGFGLDSSVASSQAANEVRPLGHDGARDDRAESFTPDELSSVLR